MTTPSKLPISLAKDTAEIKKKTNENKNNFFKLSYQLFS